MFSHLDCALKPPGEHQLKYNASATSFNGNLKKECKDQAASDESIDDSLDKSEDACTKHSHRINDNAPLRSTKLVKTKKMILKDPRNPSKLKFVSSVEDVKNSVDDVNNENSSCMEHNLALEVPEIVGDAGRSSSLEARTHSEGLDGDLVDLLDSRIGLNEAMTDATRRKRSLKMKATSRESNTMIKVKGSYYAGGTSKIAEEFSMKGHDQLPQRSRSSRHHQLAYSDDIRSSSAQKMSNRPTKKSSWLMLSKHEEGYRYIPQLGDEVVYMRQVIFG